MANVFGVIAAGRLPRADFEAIQPNQYLLTIPEADDITHLVVFLTGAAALPLGTGASVYFSWPDPNSPQTWQYLGHISNDKPSAVFRLTKLHEMVQNNNNFAFNQIHVSHVAQIGISVEPLEQISQQTPSLGPPVENFAAFTLKTAENLFNYVSSFAKTFPGSSEAIVPLSTIQQWYSNYMRKLEMNPNFWKS